MPIQPAQTLHEDPDSLPPAGDGLSLPRAWALVPALVLGCLAAAVWASGRNTALFQGLNAAASGLPAALWAMLTVCGSVLGAIALLAPTLKTQPRWLASAFLAAPLAVLFSEGSKRYFDPGTRTLALADSLLPAQQAFELATQLALLEAADTIAACLDAPPLAQPGTPASASARKLARLGLANYFAGALLLPYGAFLAAAQALRYDIELLQQRFGVGFETVCHRLSTLQRPGAPGVPFFFVRVDRAGNISKRQSATHFHFSRTGGTCPLWNVYEAFGQPGRILAQLANMPDGRRYLWVARSIARSQGGYGSPRRTFSIGLGCDLQHAARLVYSQGMDLRNIGAATPIGMGCKVCERSACPQRAFPYVAKPLKVNENESGFVPYGG